MVLFVLHAILSVVLALSAFFGQLAFGACWYIGSAGKCNYALSAGSFYTLLAVVIVVFAAVIAWIARANGRHKRSWPIPLLGSTSLVAAYILYVALINAANH
jgi:hypothetical protein